MPSRRSHLAALSGAFAVTTGCLSNVDGPADAPNRSPEADSAPNRTPETDVVLEEIGVRRAVTCEEEWGTDGVLAAADRQYVVASVDADRDLSHSDFAFAAGGTSWNPGLDTPCSSMLSVAGRDGGPVDNHDSGDEPSYLAFDVPSPLSASDPRIRLTSETGVEWPLSDDARTRLASPGPSFELRGLDVPDEVSQGDRLSVSLTVQNVSEIDGRFRAVVRWPTENEDDDETRFVRLDDVAAGDEATASLEIDTRYTAKRETSVTLSIGGHVEAEREVRVNDVPE